MALAREINKGESHGRGLLYTEGLGRNDRYVGSYPINREEFKDPVQFGLHPSAMDSTSSVKKVQDLMAENIRLRQKIQDILDANQRWQVINDQRDARIQILNETIKALKRERNGQGYPLSEMASADNSDALRRANKKAIEESIKTHETEELRRKVANLSERYETMKAKFEEDAQLLTMQVQVYKDDFEAERKERLEIQRRQAELVEELRQFKIKNKELQEKLHRNESSCCNCYQTVPDRGSYSEPILYSPSYTRNSQRDHRLVSRSANKHQRIRSDEVMVDGPSVEDNRTLSETIPQSSRSVVGNSNGKSGRSEGSLQCPNCAKVFPEQLTVQFLEHFENCQQRSCV